MYFGSDDFNENVKARNRTWNYEIKAVVCFIFLIRNKRYFYITPTELENQLA